MTNFLPCNYCSLQRIKNRSKEKGYKVTIIKSSFSMYGCGVDIYEHPKSINVKKLTDIFTCTCK